jgi:hypothetical protein
MWVVRFLFNRLEVTKADDPTVEYLFQQADGSNATEDALQADFFRLCFQKIVRSAQPPDGGTANTGLYKAGRIGPMRGIALWGPMFSVRLCSRYP